MRKPPFNRPAFSGAFGSVFGKVFGSESAFNSPLDLPDLEAWYDATDKDSINSSLGQVDSWLDKSGNGNTVSASTTERPLTGTEFINALDTIAFDGVDDFLEASSFSPTPDLTIAFVFQPIFSSNSNDAILSLNDNLAGNDDFQLDANTTPGFLCNFNSTGLGVGSGIVQSPTNLVGAPRALMSRLDTTEQSVRLYNANVEVDQDIGSYNGLLSANQSFKIGANRGAGQHLQANVGEIVIVNRAITAQERTNLFNYFARWGV